MVATAKGVLPATVILKPGSAGTLWIVTTVQSPLGMGACMWERAEVPAWRLQVSFVNSICTVKGGTHVNYVVDQITKCANLI